MVFLLEECLRRRRPRRWTADAQRGAHVMTRRLFLAAAAMIGLVAAAMPSTAQEIQERTIRWGHLNNTDHPISKGVHKFAEIVAEKSGGKLKIKEYPANQLGSEQQQQSSSIPSFLRLESAHFRSCRPKYRCNRGDYVEQDDRRTETRVPAVSGCQGLS